MATKAIHLEPVLDLSTDAFLASLKRFIRRRGLIQQLHSDNEYLNTLQPRKKNLRTMTNLRKGMIVLLHNRNLPPIN
uniref:DUF5641 domain-containing protein n=1 Tax=Anopheles minimus TaxID=112268 RepID=A0A182W3N7_9DIPT